MRIHSWQRALSVCAILIAATGALHAQPATVDLASRTAEPNLEYGAVRDFPLPKTIMFSTSPDEIVADAEEWARRGVSAFFLDYVARTWSSDVWAADNEPWTIGESDATFQKCKRANEIARRIGSEVFLKIAYDRHFEWFNDIAWTQIDNNFRQFAIFARESGCDGIALDIEYVHEQYAFDWPGYDYKGYTRQDLIAKVRERMTRVLSILYDEFPEMIFLTFPEEGFSLGGAIHAAWVEEAARRNAPGGVHYCTEVTYRNPNIRYMLGHAAACDEFFRRTLSRRARNYWKEKCSIAEGIWPFGLDNQLVYDPGMPLDEFREGYAASLMASRRYNWIYSHNAREQLIGRGLEKYTGDANIQAYLDIIRSRDIVTTPIFVEAARAIRNLETGAASRALDLVCVPRFASPLETPALALTPPDRTNPADVEAAWDLALRYFRGEPIDLRRHFATETHWMLIGPFPSGSKLAGHAIAYPPETEIDLDAQYDGVNGKVGWIEDHEPGSRATVDLKRVFQPTDNVTAYALGYLTTDKDRDVQLRFASNDAGKVWLGGELVLDYPYEGTAALDREIIPVTLKKGTTPVLLKITNGVISWGFVFRVTESDGRPAEGITFSARMP